MPIPTLFTPYSVRSITMRNRLWVAPMCEYSVEKHDGVPTDWHLVHLGGFAKGGAGLVITEATAVSAEGRISPEDTGIYSDEQRDAWSRIVAFIHSQGAVAGIQLSHAGRKASTWRPWAPERGTVPQSEGGWLAVAPSAVAFTGYAVPAELDRAGIDGIVADFAAATRRSIDAGFDVLEYGGSLENRARLLLEVIAAVRTEAGEAAALFVRFSATDWAEGGWDQEQTATVADWARDAGADFFDISTGGLVSGTTIPLAPGYQVPFADFVKHASSVEVSAVGLITEARQAEEIITSGRADAVMLARAIMRDPHFPLRAAHELGVELDYWPAQYLRAKWPA